jgi:glutamate decarboxylase
VNAFSGLIHPFIRGADDAAESKSSGLTSALSKQDSRTALVESHAPEQLSSLLNLHLPETGQGKAGVLEMVEKVLKYSVNTWEQGFMDKLYASTNAVSQFLRCRKVVDHD